MWIARWLAVVPMMFVCLSVAEAADVPAGEVTKHTFDASKVFPGTTREYWVYVPGQYDGSKPACVYVNQDGVQFDAPKVFDRLIAAGEMPVTIGVFVKPGVVPAANEGALPRFNRSFEYDGLGDGYARFILDELLPHIEKEMGLKLSHDGNDRCIGGTSSGAICAFTAAWERPDAFGRVFSGIGTYVGLRGGNDYPTLIRKVEPKPIRVFLQDGSNDLNIYAGDWWMANQTMQRALAFAGYESAHVWDEGPHNNKGATAVFADGMRYLWKDWPAKVKAGAGSPQMRELIVPGEAWQIATEPELATAMSPTETPRATAGSYVIAGGKLRYFKTTTADGLIADEADGATGVTLSPDQTLLYVADGDSHWVYSYQVQPDGSLRHKQRFYHLHVPDTADDAGAGGMCVDRDGRLYVATRMGVQVCDQAGRVNCILPMPGGSDGRAIHVWFAGEKLDTLYAQRGEKVYKRKLKVTGVKPGGEPVKPASPRL